MEISLSQLNLVSIVRRSELTCHTPTIALAIRISKMTKGSTNAEKAPSCSSNKANTNEIIAANNKILTRRSSNCSSTSCHIDLPANNKQNIRNTACQPCETPPRQWTGNRTNGNRDARRTPRVAMPTRRRRLPVMNDLEICFDKDFKGVA